MIVPKELIIEAKQKLGERAIEIIVNDLNIGDFDYHNGKGICPFHEESTPSFVFNHKDNAFKCFGCSIRYGIIDHYIQFYHLTYLDALKKLFAEVGIKYSFGEQGMKTERNYQYPHREFSEDRSKVEKYLESRGISKKTLDFADIQQDAFGNICFHYYDTNDVLSLVKYRPSHKINKGENKSWCQKDADTIPILFNMNKVDPTDGALLICEGELDCLSAIESGYKNSVSVPLGANNYGWIQTSWDWLESFDRIIVWSDNDEPGLKMRREVCSRLGIWRTLFVDAPSKVVDQNGKEWQVKDINEILYFCGKQKVLDLINNAKELPIEGVSDLSKVDDFDIETAPGLYSGIESIDNIVYKFLFGNVILVTGTRGSGKSTLLNQCFVCEPLHQGYDVFVYSGELGAPILKSWIELTMAGCEKTKMKNDFVHVIDSTARKQMREWYSERIWIYDQPTNSVDTILEKAISVTRKYGVKVWLLDNLSSMELGANDNNLNEKQRELIVKLTSLATLYNVLIVLVAHPRKLPTGQEIGGDDVGGSGSLGNLSQYMMSVKRFSKKEKAGERDGRGNWKKGKEPFLEDAEINIMKNRHTGKVESTKIFFNYTSYRFFNNAKELFKRYGWNKDNSPIPKLEDYDKRFATPDALKE